MSAHLSGHSSSRYLGTMLVRWLILHLLLPHVHVHFVDGERRVYGQICPTGGLQPAVIDPRTGYVAFVDYSNNGNGSGSGGNSGSGGDGSGSTNNNNSSSSNIEETNGTETGLQTQVAAPGESNTNSTSNANTNSNENLNRRRRNMMRSTSTKHKWQPWQPERRRLRRLRRTPMTAPAHHDKQQKEPLGLQWQSKWKLQLPSSFYDWSFGLLDRFGLLLQLLPLPVTVKDRYHHHHHHQQQRYQQQRTGAEGNNEYYDYDYDYNHSGDYEYEYNGDYDYDTTSFYGHGHVHRHRLETRHRHLKQMPMEEQGREGDHALSFIPYNDIQDPLADIFYIRPCVCLARIGSTPTATSERVNFCQAQSSYCGIPRSDDARQTVDCYEIQMQQIVARNAWPLMLLWFAGLFVICCCTAHGFAASEYVHRVFIKGHERYTSEFVQRLMPEPTDDQPDQQPQVEEDEDRIEFGTQPAEQQTEIIDGQSSLDNNNNNTNNSTTTTTNNNGSSPSASPRPQAQPQPQPQHPSPPPPRRFQWLFGNFFGRQYQRQRFEYNLWLQVQWLFRHQQLELQRLERRRRRRLRRSRRRRQRRRNRRGRDRERNVNDDDDSSDRSITPPPRLEIKVRRWTSTGDTTRKDDDNNSNHIASTTTTATCTSTATGNATSTSAMIDRDTAAGDLNVEIPVSLPSMDEVNEAMPSHVPVRDSIDKHDSDDDENKINNADPTCIVIPSNIGRNDDCDDNIDDGNADDVNDVASTQSSINSVDVPQCTICFMPLEDGDRVGDLTCQHVFHVDCLKEWCLRKNRCPLCNVPIGVRRTYYDHDNEDDNENDDHDDDDAIVNDPWNEDGDSFDGGADGGGGGDSVNGGFSTSDPSSDGLENASRYNGLSPRPLSGTMRQPNQGHVQSQRQSSASTRANTTAAQDSIHGSELPSGSLPPMYFLGGGGVSSEYDRIISHRNRQSIGSGHSRSMELRREEAERRAHAGTGHNLDSDALARFGRPYSELSSMELRVLRNERLASRTSGDRRRRSTADDS